ncbi:hypothetical protein JHK87_055291 [Glycine soja]|nr:hypothetical protein JHK87_055291 [Glycine soja]
MGPRVLHSACFSALGYFAFETVRLSILQEYLRRKELGERKTQVSVSTSWIDLGMVLLSFFYELEMSSISSVLLNSCCRRVFGGIVAQNPVGTMSQSCMGGVFLDSIFTFSCLTSRLRFRDCNHIVEIVFVEIVFGTYPLSSCLSQTGLCLRDCNHIVKFAFVEFVSALPSKSQFITMK